MPSRYSKAPSISVCTFAGMLLAGAITLGTAGPASALTVTPTLGVIDTFDAEPGQSVPTGTSGYVNGQLSGDIFGIYRFTYGPANLVPGATGHGDSIAANSFWVGPTQVFCNPAAAAAGGCGGVATPVGQTFDWAGSPGTLNYQFQTGLNTIDNGENFSAFAATLVTAVDFLPGGALGPTPMLQGSYALIGLSDGPYPSNDHDFQDMTVLVSEVPEPASLALLAFGLAGIGWARRRAR